MIKITNLNKYFYRHKSNEIHVINDVSLEFPKTGLVTIIGESGSGKTTLMNVIGGLDDFHSGSLEIDDFKIKKYSSKAIDRVRNEKVGYIFQNYLLLQQRTVYENLMLQLNMYNISLKEKNERIDYVLKSVGMMKYKKKNVSELSGGQQQRIAIARALIKSPSLILADEPTGNLDEKNTILIMNIIKKISQNTLVILVSHEMGIAESYSDYIIQVSDGKVVNKKENAGNGKYKLEDDQNLYLKEYEYSSVSDEHISIDFYANQDKKINLKIVFENGRFYVDSDQEIVVLDKDSEIKMVDEYKKELDVDTETMENDYYLEKLEFVKTPRLPLKEQIKLARSNLKKLKKRTAFLAFPLFIIIVLTLLSIQSIASVSYIDRFNINKSDSRIYSVILERGEATVVNPIAKFGFTKFYDQLREELPNIEPAVTISPSMICTVPSFTQLESVKYRFNGFSLLSTEMIEEEDLILGYMPQTAADAVVEKWVIDKLISESTIGNFLSVGSFINKIITIDNQNFRVTGIVDNEEKAVYVNKWRQLSMYPATLKKEGTSICSLSEYNKYLETPLDITLGSDEYILVNRYIMIDPISTKSNTMVFNADPDLTFNCVLTETNYECPFNYVVSDDTYERFRKSVLTVNYEKLDLVCDTEEEVKALNEFIDKVSEYYASGELKAIPENGYTAPTTFPDVKLLLSVKSTHNEILQPYIDEAKEAVSSRLLIMAAIIVVSIVIVFFTMKSYSIKNIYDIGVYRALGIKKSSIAFVYALEIFIISCKTTITGGILCYLVTNIIASIPIIDLQIAITFPMFILTTLGMILLNVLVGVLPVRLCMRQTPSKILSKYDI